MIQPANTTNSSTNRVLHRKFDDTDSTDNKIRINTKNNKSQGKNDLTLKIRW